MNKYILFIFLFISILVMSAFLIFNGLRNDKNQTVEIKKKFEKDTVFIQDDLKDLPLLLFESKTSNKDYFVILISGDGGWRGFIDNVGKTISEKGISVIGLNLIPYLSEEKTPEQIAKDIQRIIYNFSHIWKKKKVLIGGYSFGGEIIPFLYNGMDTAYQNKVDKLFLVAISNAADFKVSPVYYYNPKNSKKVLPEIQKIPDEKFIFFCDIQDETICKFLPSQNPYEIIKLNYNHLFIGHFKEVSNIIAENVINAN